jgi:gamma-glutamyltranspeptidase / glutathione hydrolase
MRILTTMLGLLVVPVTLVRGDEPTRTATAKQGMVVCVSPEAADVGVEVLKKGGNAVDAAVAVGFAMAVTYPAAGNVGGGGFMLVHPATGEPTFFDYRETAPASVTKDTFVKTTSWFDHKAAGVPGTVRGLEAAHKKFGKLPWKDLVSPAVRLAAEGFVLDEPMVKSLTAILRAKSGNDEFRVRFGKDAGKAPWAVGDRLVQADLAKVLQRIADGGADAFYTGESADLLVAEMKAGGGYITAEDLKAYKAVERKPIHGTYRGYDVFTAPPPSSGGIALVEMLNMLEPHDLKKRGAGSAEARHLMAEAMRRGFADRARYLGDPGFTKIPEFLTTKDHAKKLAADIDPAKATKSEAVAKDIPLTNEPTSTTHYSVIDKDGMAVSNTYTLEENYGSRVVVRGAGYILNNEMGDFNTRPGVTTRKGRIGTEPNLVAPGKRMLSSMTPTILAKGGKVYLVTGSPGGRTIINTVLCVVTNVIDFEMDVRAAVDFPRQHHQWFPDELRLETTDPAVLKKLEALGHAVRSHRQGDAHSILVDPKTGQYHGAADKRINGKAAGY